MIPLPPQSWQLEAAERKGHAQGLALSDPARMITVNVSGLHLVVGITPGKTQFISFRVRQDTSMDDVLAEVRRRVREGYGKVALEREWSVWTVGREARELQEGGGTEGMVISLVEPWDASVLNLRLILRVVKGVEVAEKASLGSRLRRVLGAGGDRREGIQALETLSSEGDVLDGGSVRSAPPPYDEAVRHGSRS